MVRIYQNLYKGNCQAYCIVEMLTCPKCYLQCATARDLEKHLERKVPCDAGKHECSGCGHAYTTKRGLDAHIANNRCKGKPPALIAHETALQLQQLQQTIQQSQQIAQDTVINSNETTSTASTSSPAIMPLVDSDGRLLLQSMVATDFVKSQVYFGVPGHLPKLRDSSKNDIDISSMKDYQIIKLGMKEQEEHDRFGDHSRDMGGFRVIDSVLTRFPVKLERQVLRYLKSEGLKVFAKFPGKKTWDKECALIKCHQNYSNLISFAQEMAAKIDKEETGTDRSPHQTEAGSRQADNETRKAEADARISAEATRQIELELRVAEAAEKTRQQQIDLRQKEIILREKEIELETIKLQAMLIVHGKQLE